MYRVKTSDDVVMEVESAEWMLREGDTVGVVIRASRCRS